MKSVLIIEDDVRYRKLLSMRLKSEGIKTIEAGNGRIALNKLFTNDIDLILLDLLMPEMSGWKFMYELNKVTKKVIPIIILTNLSETSYPSDIPIQLDFMVKANVSIDDVVIKIKNHLSL